MDKFAQTEIKGVTSWEEVMNDTKGHFNSENDEEVISLAQDTAEGIMRLISTLNKKGALDCPEGLPPKKIVLRLKVADDTSMSKVQEEEKEAMVRAVAQETVGAVILLASELKKKGKLEEYSQGSSMNPEKKIVLHLKTLDGASYGQESEFSWKEMASHPGPPPESFEGSFNPPVCSTPIHSLGDDQLGVPNVSSSYARFPQRCPAKTSVLEVSSDSLGIEEYEIPSDQLAYDDSRKSELHKTRVESLPQTKPKPTEHHVDTIREITIELDSTGGARITSPRVRLDQKQTLAPILLSNASRGPLNFDESRVTSDRSGVVGSVSWGKLPKISEELKLSAIPPERHAAAGQNVASRSESPGGSRVASPNAGRDLLNISVEMSSIAKDPLSFSERTSGFDSSVPESHFKSLTSQEATGKMTFEMESPGHVSKASQCDQRQTTAVVPSDANSGHIGLETLVSWGGVPVICEEHKTLSVHPTSECCCQFGPEIDTSGMGTVGSVYVRHFLYRPSATDLMGGMTCPYAWTQCRHPAEADSVPVVSIGQLGTEECEAKGYSQISDSPLSRRGLSTVAEDPRTSTKYDETMGRETASDFNWSKESRTMCPYARLEYQESHRTPNYSSTSGRPLLLETNDYTSDRSYTDSPPSWGRFPLLCDKHRMSPERPSTDSRVVRTRGTWSAMEATSLRPKASLSVSRFPCEPPIGRDTTSSSFSSRGYRRFCDTEPFSNSSVSPLRTYESSTSGYGSRSTASRSILPKMCEKHRKIANLFSTNQFGSKRREFPSNMESLGSMGFPESRQFSSAAASYGPLGAEECDTMVSRPSLRSPNNRSIPRICEKHRRIHQLPSP